MKHTGLMFTSLALCCSVASASDSTFSGNTLHMPHVMYAGAMYDVKMTFQAPDSFTLGPVLPLKTMPTDFSAVNVPNDLNFKLMDVAVGAEAYKADMMFDGTNWKVSNIAKATPGHTGGSVKSMTNLGVLEGGSRSYAYAISDDGKVIAGKSSAAEKKTFPVRFNFEQDSIEQLEDLGGGRPQPNAASNSGAIAGYATLKTEKGDPRIYNAFYNKTGTALVNIGTLGGTNSRALGINNNDMVVGWSEKGTSHEAFSYDPATSELKSLGADILGGGRAFAFDINDSGQIAGVATTADGSAKAFIIDNGTATDLGSLDDSGYSEARAINDKGETTGWSLTTDGTYAAFIHDGTMMHKITGLGGDTKAYDINTHGHIVGRAEDSKGDRHSFVYKDGQLMDLYEMLSAADKEIWKELSDAYKISDSGVVVGRGKVWTDKANDKSETRAYRIEL